MNAPAPIYRSQDGRLWWIAEGHPLTDERMAVCRAVEHERLMHTAIWERKDLSPVLPC